MTQALSSSFTDFEDAIQNYSALKANVDYLISRNVKDFKTSTLIVLPPREFLVLNPQFIQAF